MSFFNQIGMGSFTFVNLQIYKHSFEHYFKILRKPRNNLLKSLKKWICPWNLSQLTFINLNWSLIGGLEISPAWIRVRQPSPFPHYNVSPTFLNSSDNPLKYKIYPNTSLPMYSYPKFFESLSPSLSSSPINTVLKSIRAFLCSHNNQHVH